MKSFSGSKKSKASSKNRRFHLEQNTPNPFNKRTAIKFSLARPCRVRLVVLNEDKEVVAILQNAWLPAGEHKIIWDMTTRDGGRVPSGNYLYQLEADGFVAIRKLTFKK